MMPAIVPFLPLALGGINTSTKTYWRNKLVIDMASVVECDHCKVKQQRPADGRCLSCGAPLP